MADFLTRLAERTLNRVPVAKPMIASVFAPEPTLSGFLPETEAWSPLEQTQEVTAVSPAVPEIEVQSAINERQEVPTPFTPITPKLSPIIAEQEEQVGTMPTVISQDKAAKPGRRSAHKGQPNIGETDTGVQDDHQGRSYIERPDIVEQGDHQSRSYTEELDVGVQGDHKGRPYTKEPSTIPSQRLIADQSPALTGQFSLYPAPAAPGLPVSEDEPGIAARHEAPDPIRMKMEYTEIGSPVADIVSPIEASVGVSPVETANTHRREDTALSVEADSGEAHSYPMARQRISPDGELPGVVHVGEGFHRQAESPHAPIHFHDDSYSRGAAATPQGGQDEADAGPTAGDHKGPLPTSTSSPAPTMTTRSLEDTSVILVGRGPLWSPMDQTGRVEDQLPTANVSKGISPTFLRQDMPAVGGSADRPLMRATYSVDNKGISANGEELDEAGRGNADAAPMLLIQRSTGSEQSTNSANASVPGEVEAYTIGQLISSSMQNSSQPPEQHLLVPHVQAQQEVIASQETELTSVEGNNPAPTLTRSQRYSPIEQERNNRLLAEQHSVLPAAETTQAAPTVRVTIGRIDVRAIPGPVPAPSSKPAKRSPALSLDDYLKQGKGGRQ